MTARAHGLAGIVLAFACACGGASTKPAKAISEPNSATESLPTTGGAPTWSAMEAIAGQCECMVARIELYESAVLNDVDGRPTAKPKSGPDLTTCAGGANAVAAPSQNVVLAMDASPTKSSSELFETVRRARPKSSVAMSADGSLQWKSIAPAKARGREVGATPDAWRAEEEINKRLGVIGTAFRASALASQTCHARVLGAAMALTLSERHGGGATAKERASSRRALAAAARADGLAASMIGVIASYEAAAATGEGRILDRTAHALVEAMPAEGRVSDADLDALWTAARTRADAYDASTKTWSKREEDRVRAIGHDALDAKMPVLQSDAVDPNAANAALFAGDVTTATRGAATVYAGESAVVQGLAASGAIARGDYRAGLSTALKMVPADSKIGVALLLAVREIMPLKGR